jgi:branched-chain amino acid transport system substrate-binding protein
MRSKKFFVLLAGIAMILILASMTALAGCAKSTTTSSTAPAPATSSSPTPEVQTLKIGWIGPLSNPVGLGYERVLNALMDVYNASGGLAIGGQKYKVDFVEYDDKSDAPTAVAAINRLIFQDKVKFILGDDTADAWIPITESNGILAVVFSPSPAVLDPKLKYTFQTSFLNTQLAVNWTWFGEKHPEYKTVGGLFTDNVGGHNDLKQIEQIFALLNIKMVASAFFPPETTDFTSYATKIKDANPDVYTSSGVGPVPIELSWKAVSEAGFQGLLFSFRPVVPGEWAQMAPLSLLEGQRFVVSDIDAGIAQGTQTSAVCKEVQDAYIAKYGSWDYPFTDFASSWFCLKAAMESAQSLDPDKLAGVIGSGLKFDSPFGPAIMVSRPDMGNSKTVDAVFGTNLATVDNGVVKITDTITPDQAFQYLKSSGIFGSYGP